MALGRDIIIDLIVVFSEKNFLNLLHIASL